MAINDYKATEGTKTGSLYIFFFYVVKHKLKYIQKHTILPLKRAHIVLTMKGTKMRSL